MSNILLKISNFLLIFACSIEVLEFETLDSLIKTHNEIISSMA